MIKTDQPTIFPDTVKAIVSSKVDGTVKYGVDRSDEEVSANLKKLATALDLSKEQVAGLLITYGEGRTYDVIKEVSQTNELDVTVKTSWIACDALVTKQKNLGMLLPIADCNGVIVYDPEHEVLSLAHIGWHAAEANLAEKLVHYLHKKHASDPKKLLVYMSPSIRRSSYYHGDLRQKNDPKWKDYIAFSTNGYSIDIFGFVKDQLIEAGVSIERIEASPVDVAQPDNYFSHFREKQNDQQSGRFAVVCSMKAQSTNVNA